MTARVDHEETSFQTFDSKLMLHRPIRDVSLTDFDWLAHKVVYANPVLVTRLYSGVKQRAEQSPCSIDPTVG